MAMPLLSPSDSLVSSFETRRKIKPPVRSDKRNIVTNSGTRQPKQQGKRVWPSRGEKKQEKETDWSFQVAVDSGSRQDESPVDPTLMNAYPTCKINPPNPYSLSDNPSASQSFLSRFPNTDCVKRDPSAGPSHADNHPTGKDPRRYTGSRISTDENHPITSSEPIGPQIGANAVTTELCNSNTTEHAAPCSDNHSLTYYTNLETGLATENAGFIDDYNHRHHLGFPFKSDSSEYSAPSYRQAPNAPAAVSNKADSLTNNSAELPSSDTGGEFPVNMSAMCMTPQPLLRAPTRDPSPYAVHSQMGSPATHRSVYGTSRPRKRKAVDDAYPIGHTSNRGTPNCDTSMVLSPSKRHHTQVSIASSVGYKKEQGGLLREASVPSGSSRHSSFAAIGSVSTQQSPTYGSHHQYHAQALPSQPVDTVTADHVGATVQPYGTSHFGPQMYPQPQWSHHSPSWSNMTADTGSWPYNQPHYVQQTPVRETTNRFGEQHSNEFANGSLQSLEASSDQSLQLVPHSSFSGPSAPLYCSQEFPIGGASIGPPSNVPPTPVVPSNEQNGLHPQMSVEHDHRQEFHSSLWQAPTFAKYPGLDPTAASSFLRSDDHGPYNQSQSSGLDAARQSASTLSVENAPRRVVKPEPVSTIASPQSAKGGEGSDEPMHDSHQSGWPGTFSPVCSYAPPDGPATVTTRCKPSKTAKKRGKFNQEMKQMTAEIRKLRACVRCRFQKQREHSIRYNRMKAYDGLNQCVRDKNNPNGPCLGCLNYSKTSKKTLHHIPCSHAKLTDVVLYRKAGLKLTRRWRGVEMKNISDRVDPSNIRTIEWTQGLCDENFKIAVKPFRPQAGDATARFWTVRSRGKDRQMSKELQPYCLVDIHKTAVEYEAYIKRNAVPSFVKQKIQPVMTGCEYKEMHGVSEKTYLMAMKHYYTLTSENEHGTETALMRNLLILWFAMRHTTGMSWIAGEDQLDMKPEFKDETYPLYGKVSLPRMILAQFDSIHYTKILNVYGSKVLSGLETVILENQPKYWFTIYLCMFILLREASWASADRYRHARANHGKGIRYSIPTFVEELQDGCNTILMHWHYYNCQVWPEAFKADKRHRLPLGHLTAEQADLIQQTRLDPEIKRQHQLWKNWQDMNGRDGPALGKEEDGHEYTGKQQTFDWDHPLYWVSQLFEEKWYPHPTYKREEDC